MLTWEGLQDRCGAGTLAKASHTVICVSQLEGNHFLPLKGERECKIPVTKVRF